MSDTLLIEIACKSALLCAIALGAAASLRRRPPADRSRILRVAVLLLLALPFAAAWLPHLPVVTQRIEVPAQSAAPITGFAPLTPFEAAPELPPWWSNPESIVALVWAAGAALLILRLAFGLLLLARLTRTGRKIACPIWRESCERSAAAADCHRPTLVAVADVAAPLNWGWRRPVILVDPRTCDSPADADSVLAHEFAHVAQHDWPWIVASRVVVALFWINPLVWLLQRNLIEAIEEAADARAVQSVEPRRYAQSLLNCARMTIDRRLPALAAGNVGLRRRLRLVLDHRPRVSGPSHTAGAALLILTGVAAPIALAKPVTAIATLPDARSARTSGLVEPVPASAPLKADPGRSVDGPHRIADALRPVESGKAAAASRTLAEAAVADAPAQSSLQPHSEDEVRPDAETSSSPKSGTMAINSNVVMQPIRMRPISMSTWSQDSRRDRQPGDGAALPAASPDPRVARPAAASPSRTRVRYGNNAYMGDIGGQVTRSVLVRLGLDFAHDADRLDAEAANLHSKPYRDALIARAAKAGHPVTEAELLARMAKLESDARYLRRHSFGQAQQTQPASGP